MPKADWTSTTTCRKACSCLECQIGRLILTQQRVSETGTFNSAEVLRALAGTLAFFAVEILKALPETDPLAEFQAIAEAKVIKRLDISSSPDPTLGRERFRVIEGGLKVPH